MYGEDDITIYWIMLKNWDVYEVKRGAWPVINRKLHTTPSHHIAGRFYMNAFYATATGIHNFDFSLN